MPISTFTNDVSYALSSSLDSYALVSSLNNYYPTSNPNDYISWAQATNGTLALNADIPTNNNQLTNGAGYITNTLSSNLNANSKNVTSVDCITFSNGASWCGA